MWGSVYRWNLYWLADCPRLVWSTQHLFYGDVAWDNSQWRFLVQYSIAKLEQCCKHSKQCHNNVASLCHCELSHVTLPLVIYLILLFTPLARCGRIGNSFTRTSCRKSNVTCGKSTLNPVNLHGNLLCLRVIGDKSQFFYRHLYGVQMFVRFYDFCWAFASGPCLKLKKTKVLFLSLFLPIWMECIL